MEGWRVWLKPLRELRIWLLKPIRVIFGRTHPP